MKRLLASAFIAAYLFALSMGVFCHAVNYKVGSHPAMYFVVWDMFCGWAAHSTRMHVLAEGESGAVYELAPGPWGEYKPFGSLGRRHYDSLALSSANLAMNCLRHTKHEPIARIFIVEENWPKKYNLPDSIWEKHFDGPKEKHSYYQTRYILSEKGMVLRANPNWFSKQANLAIADNPRLQAESRRGKAFFAVSPQLQLNGMNIPQEYLDQSSRVTVGSPLGQ
jgi:hypothetical protein